MVVALTALIAMPALANGWVLVSTSESRYAIDQVPACPAAIVLGAYVLPDGQPSPVLEERVRAAVALYRAGKVRRLLISGDNGRAGYDEVTAMKKEAVRLGVPPEDVVRDYAGFRTYDSCYRARAIFGVDHAILVTQWFHLSRALFLARHLGIDAVGCEAPDPVPDSMHRRLEVREIGARTAAVLDLFVLHRSPRFLGPKEPLFNGQNPFR
jgi:vancomycin permeability regulator SanA